MKHREKQLLAAAFRYGLQMNPGDIAGSQSISHDFLQGARWADANPPCPWTSVRDSHPPIAPGETALSQRVLVHRTSGYIDFDRYDYRQQAWLFKDRNQITHWMPIPPATEPAPPTGKPTPATAPTAQATLAREASASRHPSNATNTTQPKTTPTNNPHTNTMPTTHTTRTSYLLSLLRRDSKGRLLLPRCVASHINEIDRLMPGAITDSDRRQLEHIANLPDKPIR